MKLLYIIFSSKKKKNSISTLLPNAMTTFFYYLTLHSQRNRHTTHTHTPVFCSISRGSLARVKFLPTTTNYYTCIPWLLETRCRCSSEYSKLRSVEKVHYQTFFTKNNGVLRYAKIRLKLQIRGENGEIWFLHNIFVWNTRTNQFHQLLWKTRV